MARNKKERDRLKRKKKQLALRKARNISPYRQLADAPVTECSVNAGWKKDGLASIGILKPLREGGHALVGFLVDLTCFGLKDAFVRLGISLEDYRAMVERRVEAGGAAEAKMDLCEAQRLVAGGILFTRKHGFRLPPHYERAVSAIGVPANPPPMDLSGLFGMDGDPEKLMFIGDMPGLHKRLIDKSAQEFLGQPNVKYMAEVRPSEVEGLEWDEEEDYEDEEYEDEEAGEGEDLSTDDVKQAVDRVTARVVTGVRQWCLDNRQAPDAKLPEAAMLATLQALAAGGRQKSPDNMPEELRTPPGLEKAMWQISAYLKQFRLQENMLAAMGMDEDETER